MSVKQLINNQEFKKYLKNTSWLMSEKALRLISGLVVGVYVARYLGPGQLGLLSYTLSIVALFATLNHLGLNGLTVRELVQKPEQKAAILGTVFTLKFVASVFAILAILLFSVFTEQFNSIEFWMLLVTSCAIFFQPLNVIEFWFESKVLGKFPSIAKSVSVILVAIFKVLLIIAGAQVLFFSLAFTIEATLIGLIFILFYNRQSQFSLAQWRFEFPRAKYLLSQSWMIMFGAIFATIYLKVDQVMLMWLSEKEQVGVYAVAAQLSEVWHFAPVAIVASLFPRLITLKETNSKQYQLRLQQIFDLLFLLAFMLTITTTLLADPIIATLYGEKFERSASILQLHIWSSIFIFMRALFSRWIHIERVFVFSFISQGAGALSNVLLNLMFIPLYGAEGAAVTTLISYAIASYLSLAVYDRTRPVFWMMSKSLLLPFRWIALKQTLPIVNR